jgi:hypothetical protein
MSPPSAPLPEHRALTDHDLGRAFVVGTCVGLPLVYAFALVLLSPFGWDIAAAAGIFVALAAGPFFGTLIALVAQLTRLERQPATVPVQTRRRR